jgi:uncharacterized protein with NRDE domain
VNIIIPRNAKYAGFNMLLLAPKLSATDELHFEASFVSNGGAGGVITLRPLSPEERSSGGFSNGVDGKGGSEWPKVKVGMELFASAMKTLSQENDESKLSESLFDLLRYVSLAFPSQRSVRTS